MEWGRHQHMRHEFWLECTITGGSAFALILLQHLDSDPCENTSIMQPVIDADTMRPVVANGPVVSNGTVVSVGSSPGVSMVAQPFSQ